MTDVALDCRWLGIGGAGRVTGVLLQGLAADPPEGAWTLVGPAAAAELAWPGAEVVLTEGDPRRLRGQAGVAALGRAGLAVYLHQQRPLRPGPSVTCIYDTVQIRNATTPAGRRLRRSFLRAAAALSREVVTISAYSRDCIHRDLGYPLERITVAPPPVDPLRAARLVELRRATPRRDLALYVGQFAPHKNLDRLIEAFGRTDFAAAGGRLVVAGGRPAEAEALGKRLGARVGGSIEVRSWVDEDTLDELMASARMLVQPSLEEGYGLPVAEAQACGLPVCVSTGGSLPELTAEGALRFSPTSTADMAASIDACALAPEPTGPQVPATMAAVVDFARAYRQVIARALQARSPAPLSA